MALIPYMFPIMTQLLELYAAINTERIQIIHCRNPVVFRAVENSAHRVGSGFCGVLKIKISTKIATSEALRFIQNYDFAKL
jgi:hypothetical protein